MSSTTILSGRYELIERIGEGGMAVVYKAKDRLLNRYVAVKILRPEYTKDVQFVDNFKRESQAAAGLQHPNIVAIYDVGVEDDINYIVMELIDGRPLSDIIEEKAPLDYKTSIAIAKQLASALSLAHKHDIVHRDVKPHNVMITRDGMAKLADFGIAKAVSNSTLAADTSNKILGSVHYFSPEQARGAYVDARTDIYSLGIVLYEMLTGQVPFDGENPVQVALMHINDEITPPTKLVPGIPPALEKVVLKATDKYQSNRYRTADELLEDLENIEFVSRAVGNAVFAGSNGGFTIGGEDEPSQSEKLAQIVGETGRKKPSGTPQKPKSEEDRKRKKKIVFITAGVVAALVILLAVLFATGVLGGGSSDEEQVTVPDLTNLSLSDAKAELEDLGLKIKEGDPVPSKTIKEGKVVSQTPIKGTKVKKGKTITVQLSEGDKKGLVPSLINKQYVSRGDLETLLAEYGYKLGEVKEEESDYEKGMIIAQDPAAGSTAEEGTYINITVSKGKAELVMPDLSGMTEEDVKAEMDKMEIYVEFSYEESSTVNPGYVINQSPSKGTKLEQRGRVSVVIAKQSTERTVPDWSRYKDNPDAYAYELETMGLNANVQTVTGSAGVAGQIIGTDPAPGANVRVGDTITISVSDGSQP